MERWSKENGKRKDECYNYDFFLRKYPCNFGVISGVVNGQECNTDEIRGGFCGENSKELPLRNAYEIFQGFSLFGPCICPYFLSGPVVFSFQVCLFLRKIFLFLKIIVFILI